MIFKTLNYAEHLKDTEFIKCKDYFSKSIVVSQYLIKNNYTDEQITDFLNEKFDKDNDIPENIRLLRIKDIIHYAHSNDMLENKTIYFSIEELEFIKSFNDLNIEKVLFVMFCLQKFDGEYFHINITELMRTSDVHLNTKGQKRIIYKIYNDGVFEIGEKKNKTTYRREVSYWFTDKTSSLYNEDNIALAISDYSNLILYYLMYFEYANVSTCKQCNKLFKQNSNRQLYCKKCSKQIRLEKERIRQYNLYHI